MQLFTGLLLRCKPCIGFLAAISLVISICRLMATDSHLYRVRSKLLIQRCANAPYAASKQAAISCISITKPSGAICNELHHASASLINISITPEVLCVSIRITHSVILCIHNTIVLCILIRHYMSYYNSIAYMLCYL